MFSGIGGPEGLILLAVVLFTWAIPIAVVVWILVALSRIRRTQTEILDRLDELARERQGPY